MEVIILNYNEVTLIILNVEACLRQKPTIMCTWYFHTLFELGAHDEDSGI